MLLPVLQQNKKFKFVVNSFGRHISMQEQVHIIEMFKKFPLKDEDVDLEKPDLIFRVNENLESGH